MLVIINERSELSRFNVKISAMPNGLEKYMAFTINRNLVFIDSMQFMNSSLDSLVKNVKSEDFKDLSEECSGEKLGLLKEKRIYPYEYIDRFKRFNEDKLPNKSKFLSSLKDNRISKEDYDRAIKVWNVFKIKTLGGYHDLYLKTDVLLLSNVFDSPGSSWDSMLKMTGIKLQTISDINVQNFIEKDVGGGISDIYKRHSKAIINT